MPHLQWESVACWVLVEVLQIHIVNDWLIEDRQVHLLGQLGSKSSLTSACRSDESYFTNVLRVVIIDLPISPLMETKMSLQLFCWSIVSRFFLWICCSSACSSPTIILTGFREHNSSQRSEEAVYRETFPAKNLYMRMLKCAWPPTKWRREETREVEEVLAAPVVRLQIFTCWS